MFIFPLNNLNKHIERIIKEGGHLGRNPASVSLYKTKKSLKRTVINDFKINKYIYIMAIPVMAYFIIFHYIPMYGAIIAFKQFSPGKGIIGSDWVGLDNFVKFFNSVYFTRVVRNTILINLYGLIFGFPAPIIFAILLNEISKPRFKKAVQTITYMPHFISVVVVAGMIVSFTARNGFIGNFVARITGENVSLLMKPEYFRTIYIASGIWQELGFNSIIYLAAISSIDPQLYEAARMDGAGRFKQAIHITFMGILPTVIILLIMRIGNMMSLGFEKIILLYNPLTYETADVISSFVYRRGLQEFDYSFSAAVGLFNSVINFTLLICANLISRKTQETSLW